MPNKWLILGHGDHGKDCAAEILNDRFGITHISSSWAALKLFLYPILQERYGYHSPPECFEDRRNKREEWEREISAYNTPDKGRLCRNILDQYDCYVGMRRWDEFEATKHLFTRILWVDAGIRKSKDPTMTIKFDPETMWKVDNNGREDELAANLLAVTRDIDARLYGR